MVWFGPFIIGEIISSAFQFQIMAFAVDVMHFDVMHFDVMHGHGPSNKMRHQLYIAKED